MEDKLNPCPIPNCRGMANVYNGGIVFGGANVRSVSLLGL